jgi:hypothetical protein
VSEVRVMEDAIGYCLAESSSRGTYKEQTHRRHVSLRLTSR